VIARAVVFEEAGRAELRPVELRAPEADEIVVETRYSSISSGTERLLFNGKLPGMPQIRYPLVPGYEAAGTVVSVGGEVQGVAVGDDVFVGGSSCFADVAAAFGGQSSRTIKRASQAIQLNGIAPEQAPLLALAATALHGVRRLGDVRGQRVAVLGMGAVGQLAANFLYAQGAAVVAVDRSPQRLTSVRAAETIDVSAAPLEAQLAAPVAHAIEATGVSGEIARCARAISPGGKIVLLSYYNEIAAPFVDLFVKEATLLVSREWTFNDLLFTRDAIAGGVVSLDALASFILPIEQYASAYDTAFNDPSVLKVVLQWA
jgi:3-hydroxyethyl bacteriochlorophyllide a dehydrogenase